MILGRYKNHCNFYLLLDHENKCSLTEIHKQSSKIPYVSADLNLINTNQYCTVNVGRSVTLWDMTKMLILSITAVFSVHVL